jgi:hypothetical protein
MRDVVELYDVKGVVADAAMGGTPLLLAEAAARQCG